jgi:putative membrane protein
MLWVKAFHIVFIASWFAGLFYLPRIYVNLAMVESKQGAEYQRLVGMAHRLYRFMTILMVPALGLGLWLWLGVGIGEKAPWMHAKLSLVLFIVAYHFYCKVLLSQFQAGRNTHSHRWYRFFNEIPVLLMIAVVILVVVKPF